MRAVVRLLLSLLFLTPSAALAFERSDGVQVRCEVERQVERRSVPDIWTAHDRHADRYTDLGGAAFWE